MNLDSYHSTSDPFTCSACQKSAQRALFQTRCCPCSSFGFLPRHSMERYGLPWGYFTKCRGRHSTPSPCRPCRYFVLRWHRWFCGGARICFLGRLWLRGWAFSTSDCPRRPPLPWSARSPPEFSFKWRSSRSEWSTRSRECRLFRARRHPVYLGARGNTPCILFWPVISLSQYCRNWVICFHFNPWAAPLCLFWQRKATQNVLFGISFFAIVICAFF